MTQTELHELIELYFDGLTSLEQEKALRRALADTSVQSPEANEARAVLGYAAASPKPTATPARTHRTILRPLTVSLSAAASLACVIACGWIFFNRAGQEQFIAYVDGVKTDNSSEVMEIVNSDLSMLGEASADINNDISGDLNIFSNAINSENATL